MVNLSLFFSFNGRIRRLQWWIGSLIAVVATLAFVFISILILRAVDGGTFPSQVFNSIAGFVFLAAYGALIWSQLAMSVKRLHDRDNSGWWVLLSFVPLLGIALFVMLGFLDGTQGPNDYGPSPKGIGGTLGAKDLNSVFS